MTSPSVATSHWQAMIFYEHHQTVNLIITPPALTAGNFARDSFIAHRHKFYAFTLFAFLALLQIQSAGNTTSPFKVHPVTITTCVFGILAYYLASRARQCLPLYTTQINIAMTIFGSLFLACSVTLLVPDSWWHIKYIFYILLGVVELHQVVTVIYDKYFWRFILKMRCSLNSGRHLLPLSYRDSRGHNNA